MVLDEDTKAALTFANASLLSKLLAGQKFNLEISVVRPNLAGRQWKLSRLKFNRPATPAGAVRLSCSQYNHVPTLQNKAEKGVSLLACLHHPNDLSSTHIGSSACVGLPSLAS